MSAEQFDKEAIEIARWYATRMRDELIALTGEYKRRVEALNERYPDVPDHLKDASLKRMVANLMEAQAAIENEIEEN